MNSTGRSFTFAVCIRHGDDVLFATVEKHKTGRAVHERRQRVAVELGLGENAAADHETLVTIGDVEC